MRIDEQPKEVEPEQASMETNVMDGKMIAERVHAYYHLNDLNCVTTTLKILAENCNLPLGGQVLDAAVGMHGATTSQEAQP
jgi:hypothetical protein